MWLESNNYWKIIEKGGEIVSEENIWKVGTFGLKASGTQGLLSM